MADLDAVTAVEAVCFPPEEAANRDTFRVRLQQFPERFFVAEQEDCVIGIVNGCASDLPLIEDRLFHKEGHEPNGCNQMIFGLAVLPEYQCRGIGAMLMHRIISFAREQGMKNVVLTCKAHKVAYYEKFGFVNLGVSVSNHGGAQWFEMVLTF